MKSKFMNKHARQALAIVLILFFAYPVQKAMTQNAPVSTVSTVVTTGNTAAVSITATNIINIGSTNQQLLYDPSIATAVSVTMAPGVPSLNLDFNVTTPGVIRFGWAMWPGITLPDDSPIFILNFTKVTSGTTAITWDADYFDRQWSNGNFQTLNDLPLVNYYFPGSLTWQNDAPVTTAPVLTACRGETIDVPVKVTGFNTIGKVGLKMEYDPLVLSYASGANTSGFPGLTINGATTGEVIISGTSPTNGITLADNSVLFTLQFSYLGGSTDLEWIDNGTSCQHTGPPPGYNILADGPAYYVNGSVASVETAQVKLFLEGLYNSGIGLLNKAQDWNGSTFEDKFTGTVVDLITVELHSPGSYGTPLFVVEDIPLNQNGTAFFCLTEAMTGSYYITIKNRNHLETVSAGTVDFSVPVSYDFTTAATQAYGSNMKQLATGVWGIYAGDIVKDGVINTSDREPINDDYLITKRGYFPNDINGDGTINTSDREIVNDAYLQTITRKIPN